MSLPTSDDDMVFLHNPRCSKSRAVKALLEEKGATVRERLYLEEPLTRDELADLAGRLGKPAAEFVRSGESAFSEAGLTKESSAEAILDAMASHPILLERPILVRGDKAKVGRPPEGVLELL